MRRFTPPNFTFEPSKKDIAEAIKKLDRIYPPVASVPKPKPKPAPKPKAKATPAFVPPVDDARVDQVAERKRAEAAAREAKAKREAEEAAKKAAEEAAKAKKEAEEAARKAAEEREIAAAAKAKKEAEEAAARAKAKGRGSG